MRATRLVGITEYHFHDLRHYWCTQSVNSGIDAGTVSRCAGHSTVSFTLQVHFHPTEDTAAPLGASVDAALGAALGKL